MNSASKAQMRAGPPGLRAAGSTSQVVADRRCVSQRVGRCPLPTLPGTWGRESLRLGGRLHGVGEDAVSHGPGLFHGRREALAQALAQGPKQRLGDLVIV